DSDSTQAVEQILTELVFLQSGLKIPVRGRQGPDVHRDLFIAANPLNVFFLEHPQQFDLCAQAQVADFIEEDGAVIGLLKAADAASVRPGERAALMPEQFTLQERLRDGRAIDRDERLRRATAVLVDGARNQFL